MNLKIKFILFASCLFFLVLITSEILQEGLKSGMELFWQLSRLIPFLTSAVVFGNNIYSKKALQK